MARAARKTQNKPALPTKVTPDWPPAPPTLPWPRGLIAAVALLVVAATIVRLWAAQDQLWMDEIWSLIVFASDAKSPLDIFTFHHDNNHYLNTLWMYVLGPYQKNWFWYRLPSVIAGVATVPLAAAIARRWGTFAAIAAAVLTSASYMLIVYASEARGYATAGCFALVAFLALDRWLSRPRARSGALFACATILGTLSHLTFVQFYFAALVWSAVVCWKQADTARQAVTRLALLHAVPMCFLGLMYVIDVRGMVIGGGTPLTLSQVLVNSLALAVGCFAKQPAVMLSLGLLGVAAALVSIFWLLREKSDVGVFFATAIFIAPALLLAVQRPTQLYERYFYLNLLFLWVLLSYFLARLWQFGSSARMVSLVALVAIVAGNCRLTYEFLAVGRGHYFEALQHMVDHSARPEVTIANNGKRTRDVVYAQYYDQHLPGKHKSIRFQMTNENKPLDPEWIIRISQEQPYTEPPQEVYSLRNHDLYVLEGVFPYFGLSGMNFAIFHRAEDRRALAEP
jgi:hypothetical protein